MRNLFDPRTSNKYPTDRQFLLHHINGNKTEVQLHDGELHELGYRLKQGGSKSRPMMSRAIVHVSDAVQAGYLWSHCTE